MLVDALPLDYNICKNAKEKKRPKERIPWPLLRLVRKRLYLVAPQEEHLYPVVTVSS